MHKQQVKLQHHSLLYWESNCQTY